MRFGNFDVDDLGTLIAITPLTAEAKQWLKDNTTAESWQWWGEALLVDHRVAEPLVHAIAAGDPEV